MTDRVVHTGEESGGSCSLRLLCVSTDFENKNKGSVGCVKVTRFICHQENTHSLGLTVCLLSILMETSDSEKWSKLIFSRTSLVVYILLLTSSPVTDSTLRLFFILIGSFWAPGRSVPEPRQQSRWRARTGEIRGHCKVKPGSDRVTTGPHWSWLSQPTASLALLSTPQCLDGWNQASNLPVNAKDAFMCPSEAPRSVWAGWPLFWSDVFSKGKGGRKKNF